MPFNQSMQKTDLQSKFQKAVQVHMKGQVDTAKLLYQDLLRFYPNHVPSLNNLGAILLESGDHGAAAEYFKQVIQHNPKNGDAWNNLGVIQKEVGSLRVAKNHFEKALKYIPEDDEVHSNLGAVLKALGEPDQAEIRHRNALELNPGNANAHNNLALVLKEKNRLQEAVIHFRKALGLNPDDEKIYFNLSDCLVAKGDFQGAVVLVKEALARFPESMIIKTGGVKVMIESGHWEKADLLFQSWIRHRFLPSELSLLRYLMLYINATTRPPMEVAQIHHQCGRLIADYWQKTGEKGLFDHAGRLTENGKIRIGYLSPDFNRHSVGWFVNEIIKHHNTERFDIYCYSLSQSTDAMTQSIRQHASEYRDVTYMEDIQIGRCIYDDRVQILIDLAGYTTGNRLDIFALKPAPVQITAIGYPHGTGLPMMDYRMTDDQAEGPAAAHEYQERLIHLPHCFLPLPRFEKSEVVHKKSDIGVPIDAIILTSFNALHKLRPEVLALWNRILRHIPNAYLLFSFKHSTNPYIQHRILSHFEEKTDRIVFLPQTKTIEQHRTRYRLADLALDPFPYNGTTTSWEALSMGVPVITLKGDRHVQRTTFSILANIGIPELAVETESAYLALAVGLAKNPDRLHRLKDKVARQAEETVQTGNQAYVRDLEKQYIQIVQENLKNPG